MEQPRSSPGDPVPSSAPPSGSPPVVSPPAVSPPAVSPPAVSPPAVSVERTATEVVLVLRGEIDVLDAGLVRAAGLAAVETDLPVTLDCHGLTFLDSSALALFARLLKARRPVTVVGARPHLTSLLTRTGLLPLVTLRED